MLKWKKFMVIKKLDYNRISCIWQHSIFISSPLFGSPFHFIAVFFLLSSLLFFHFKYKQSPISVVIWCIFCQTNESIENTIIMINQSNTKYTKHKRNAKMGKKERNKKEKYRLNGRMKKEILLNTCIHNRFFVAIV